MIYMGLFHRRKVDVFEYFKEFQNMVENMIGKHIKIPRLDQEGEYKIGDLIKYCKNNGV